MPIGFLLVLAGVAGLFAEKTGWFTAVTTGPSADHRDGIFPLASLPYVTGASIALIAIGALVFLIAANEEWGVAFWLFALACAVVAELIKGWLPPELHTVVVWIAIGMAVLVGLAVIVGLVGGIGAEEGPYAGGLAAAAIGLMGLIVWGVFPLGAGWAPAVGITATALLTGGLAATPLGRDFDAALDNPPRVLGATAGAGVSLAVTSLVVAETFDVRGVAWVLLALLIVLGFFAVGPLVVYGFFKTFFRDQSQETQDTVIVVGGISLLSGGLGTYFVVLLNTTNPGDWLQVTLVVLVIVSYVAMAASAAFLLFGAGQPPVVPETATVAEPPPVIVPQVAPELGARLAHLATHPDRVYRLLPRN
ncbi:hypothetical protein [Actinokineospora iranica]|uniref:Uncharacterized protein n=1 Tax=Actinokineospora iranica TaxID=1271860 RepID=A0A1G6TT19_9PSEU|nr:hypothetical protein [Actinokineospora iranica]SDD31475.1 hypothetical protein SAMN05216174_109271 [Actinokineospora iranica]